MEDLKGQLLVAGGGLLDPNFRQAVVMVAEHGAEGALGVVLNRPLEVPAAEAGPELEAIVTPGDSLFSGGPVQPQAAVIVAEFESPDANDEIVFGRVGLLGHIDPAAGARVRRARVYAGYAGWGPGQLERELADSSWIVEPALPEDVFTTEPSALWRTVLQRKGSRYAMLSLMPFDPSTN